MVVGCTDARKAGIDRGLRSCRYGNMRLEIARRAIVLTFAARQI